MTTKFLGMKKFRDNISTYVKLAQKKPVRYIILKKNVPVLEVHPIDEKAFAIEKLETELQVAEKQARAGRVYTHEEVLKELGLQ